MGQPCPSVDFLPSVVVSTTHTQTLVSFMIKNFDFSDTLSSGV